MEQTAEQCAWACGHDIGLQDGRVILAGGRAGLANSGRRVPHSQRVAFMNGYGHGIADAAGPIAGHHLAHAVDAHRHELVPQA